ncbi:MAG: DUF2274 domain-containing protein [Pseudomonadota bacterium]
MTDLKLGKLPDRTPVKMTIAISPGLNRALQAYADIYREAYGQAEPVTELIPYMLERFLAGDRTYVKALKKVSGQVAKSTRRRQRPVEPDQSSAES